MTEKEIYQAIYGKRNRVKPKGKRRKRKKKLRPGRLDAAGMKALREERYEKDEGKCVDCGRHFPLEGSVFVRMHLAHVLGRGAGGPDTLENTVSKCFHDHIIKEHGLKSSKRLGSGE